MNLIHWRHYLALERELLEISQYIEICQENFCVHSVKFSHLLMASASEFETVGGLFCKKKAVEGTGINSILDALENIGSNFKQTEVEIPLHQLKLKPLEDCGLKTPPAWWTANNKVKHHRDTDFKLANLGNVLMSMCGLLIMLGKYYHEEKMTELNDTSIPMSTALSDLTGSVSLLLLPDDWYHAW
jgi:hypothetical protein